MELKVSIDDEKGQGEIASLYGWLSQDPDVIREADLSLSSASDQESALGPSLEIINIIISNSIAAASVVLAAITLWRQNRSSTPEVRIEAVNTSISVNVSSDDSKVLAQKAAELAKLRQEDIADGAGSS